MLVFCACCKPRSRPDVFPGPIRGFNYSKKQDIKVNGNDLVIKVIENNDYTIDQSA